MTIIKDITFPNSPASSYSEAPYVANTEVVRSAAGRSYRNARQTQTVRRIQMTLSAPDFNVLSSEYADILAVLAAVSGQLYGFKFVSLLDSTELDVVFKSDEYRLNLTPAAIPLVTCSVELEQVLDGIPEP